MYNDMIVQNYLGVMMKSLNNQAMKLPKGVTQDQLLEPIRESITIQASASTVWKIISQSGGMTNFSPFVKEDLVDFWSEGLYKDTIRYHSGYTLYREIYNWLEGIGYDVQTDTALAKPYTLVSWRVIPLTDLTCEISISIFLLIQKDQETLTPEMADRLHRYLQYTLKGLEYYTITGNRVSKNQFGYVEGISG